MAKKSFKKDGKGFQGLNFQKELENEAVEQEPVEESQSPQVDAPVKKPTSKNTDKNPYRQSKKGYERYTFMIDADYIPQVKDLAQTTGVKIKDVLNAAVAEYLKKNWSKERQEKIKQLRAELGLD